MKNKYTVQVGTPLEGEFDTWDEAFVAMYKEIKKQIDDRMEWQILETMTWIQLITSENQVVTWDWYSARDQAYEYGLLCEGKLASELTRFDMMDLEE